MTLYNFMKMLHVIAAVVFVGGLFARQVIRSYARTIDDVTWFSNLSRTAAYVETVMVKPGSLIIVVLGVIQARLGGIPIFGFLSGGDQNWLLVSIGLYLAAFLLVPLVFIPKGRAFRPLLDAGLSQGRITPELRLAIDDRTVALAHHLETAAVLVVLVLMVLKPF